VQKEIGGRRERPVSDLPPEIPTVTIRNFCIAVWQVTAELAYNKSATAVDLSSNRLESTHAATLLRAFTSDNGMGSFNDTVHTLILSNNHIGGPPYQAGAPVFKDGKPVEHFGGMVSLLARADKINGRWARRGPETENDTPDCGSLIEWDAAGFCLAIV
jgi:hypothetical protein